MIEYLAAASIGVMAIATTVAELNRRYWKREAIDFRDLAAHAANRNGEIRKERDALLAEKAKRLDHLRRIGKLGAAATAKVRAKQRESDPAVTPIATCKPKKSSAARVAAKEG